MTKRRLAVLVLSAGLAASCGDDSPRTPTSPSPPSPDPRVLAVTCPTGVVASTTGSSTAVTFPAPTTTGGTAPVTVTCSPFSGSTFQVGASTVSCQAVDARNTAAACSFTVLVSRIPTLTRTRFLAFGDSTTAGEVTQTTSTFGLGPASGRLILVPQASYPTQLRTFLVNRYTAQASSIQVFNAGRSGESAFDALPRFRAEMNASQPQAVLLLQGYNDLNLYGSRGINAGIAGIDGMAREARGRGARVFIASLTPSRPGGNNTIDPNLVADYNARLRTLAAGENAVFVDLFTALIPSLTTYIGPDGLHPSEAGYRRMAEEFFTAIRATLETVP